MESHLETLNITDKVDVTLKLEKLREIGGEEGKNSQVWLVNDVQLNEELILKGVLKSDFKIAEIDEYYMETRIINECKSPHVVPVKYAGMDETYVYMTLPYCKNGSLNTVCEGKNLTLKQLVTYALEFLNGLLFLHTKEVLHLDIKPTNILIDNSGKAILTDFGLSKYLNEDGVAYQNKIYGSHVVPEMYSTRDRTVSIDIYNVGLTLYRMFNGEEQFKKQFFDITNEFKEDEDFFAQLKPHILEGKFPDRKYYLPHIPKKIRGIIEKALKVNPTERYSNVLQILNDFSRISDFLEWKVIISENLYIWECEDALFKYEVKLTIKTDKAVLEGFKHNIKKGTHQRISKFNKIYSSKEEAFKDLEKLLKDKP